MAEDGFVRPVTYSKSHRKAQFSGLNQASERRRGDILRAQNVSAATHVVQGTREILGAGESLIEVSFPIRFTQVPFFLSGAALAYGTELVDDDYPVVSAVVAYWDIDEPDLELFGVQGRQFFRGASIAVTATGPEDQRLYFNWQFSGMAISNPAGKQNRVPVAGETSRVIS